MIASHVNDCIYALAANFKLEAKPFFFQPESLDIFEDVSTDEFILIQSQLYRMHSLRTFRVNSSTYAVCQPDQVEHILIESRLTTTIH